jgi:hypothetical protein
VQAGKRVLAQRLFEFSLGAQVEISGFEIRANRGHKDELSGAGAKCIFSESERIF